MILTESQVWVEQFPYIVYLNKENKGLQGLNSTFWVGKILKTWNFKKILRLFKSSRKSELIGTLFKKFEKNFKDQLDQQVSRSWGVGFEHLTL